MCFSTDKPGPPGVPQFSEVTNSSVRLSWTAPVNDGGASIFNYVVESKPEDGFKWSRVTEDTITDTHYTVRKLAESSEFVFRVSAENKAGIGPSSQSQPVIIKEPLGENVYWPRLT